jgi:predicted proteasome-type protease
VSQRRTPTSRNARNEVATLVGDALREIRKRDEPYLRSSGIDPSGSFVVGGQIQGEAPRLFLVYSEGNSSRAIRIRRGSRPARSSSANPSSTASSPGARR